MHKFLYKYKSPLLKLKRLFNKVTGIEIIKYPTPELHRRIQLIKNHDIDVVIDVGANIGQFGSEMRNMGFSGKIISFEPLKDAFLKLTKVSSKDPLWEVHNISLGERDGKTYINIAQNSVSSSLLENLPQLTESAPGATFVNKEIVEVRRLDTIFKSLGISENNIYLKIDTQGYEKMVLEGAADSLQKIKGIQIEMALFPSYTKSLTFDETKKLLESKGFILMALENGFYDKNTGKQLEADGIFFKT
ncbi:FkbM family methyltransferase [Flavobacterium sp. J372]|uniref:FkbM family methyltransferase n=1 Tax=Flavobacterium sp. J372 TaxID=2898436 RepID=UPI002151118D|nr:FkbM family methyltransferase [Flavobacterium sp. J372]MCR5861172.1 FkbM family methyltransferase [Flavobacterium sp. J372]